MFTLKVSIGSWGIGDRTSPKAHKELHVSFDLRSIASTLHWFIFHFFFHFQQTKTTPIKLHYNLIKTSCTNMLNTNPGSNQQCLPIKPIFFFKSHKCYYLEDLWSCTNSPFFELRHCQFTISPSFPKTINWCTEKQHSLYQKDKY